ncbi:MAG: sulfite exporter TauE/SafE family protein [Candidatus Methylacidiphilales bacterium]
MIGSEFDPVSPAFAFACLAVMFVGLAKSGLGGGAAILATPLLALVFDPRAALGILLPLLILSDWVALWCYRRSICWEVLRPFLPGAILGIGVAAFFLGEVDDVFLRQCLGAICLGFCGLQLLAAWRGRSDEPPRSPSWRCGFPIGAAAGWVSAVAHAAGPVAAMYLLPLRLPSTAFMATTVAAFTVINLTKLPFYLGQHLIGGESLVKTLALAPAMLAGTFLGVWLNHRINRVAFTRVVYVVLFFAGLELVTGRSLVGWAWAVVTGAG